MPTRIGTAAPISLLAGSLCAAALVVWTRAHPPPLVRPNVLLVVVDSLRQDRLASHGGERGLTPFLDRFARGAIVFDRAYAPSSWTMPTVASLFLGRYPTQHRITRFYTQIPGKAATLAAILEANGYATSAVTANATLNKAGGFDNGFERFELVGEPTVLNPKSDGALVNAALLRMVDAVGAERPHFVYAHYMDAHAPYRAHEWTAPRRSDLGPTDEALNLRVMTGAWEADEEARRRRWTFLPEEVERLEQLYDGEVRQVDAWIEDLFRGLARRGFLRHAVVIVTADHGEEFGERGVFYHGVSLFEAAIHVPLLLRLPEAAAERIVRPVQIAGLGAMLLGQLGIAVPESFGIGATPLEPVPLDTPAYALSELEDTGQMKIWLHQKALVGRHAKLLMKSDGEEEAFEIDPSRFGEPAPPDVRRDLIAALRVLESRGGGTLPDAADLDAATLERLHGLGYFPDRN